MKYTLSLFILFLLFACNPAGKLIKEGDKKREAGLHEDASNYYYNALISSPKSEKAKAGLTISAQEVLNEKFTNFNKLVVENKIDEAIKAYKNAERYNQTAQNVGVQLRWPTEYNEVYVDIREEYILKLYDDALALMNNKQYEQAEHTFEQIANLDSNYRGITVLRINTVLEPLYQNGLTQMSQSKYRQAFTTFSKVVQQDETYKDAKALMNEANAKATTTVGILPVKNITTNTINTLTFDEQIESKIKKHAFAYVQIEDASALRNTLETRGWNNITEATKAAEAARNLGLKYIVLVVIKGSEYKQQPPTTELKNAYEAFSENILNPYTGTYSAITKFRKVTYDDTYEQRSYSADIEYQLIQASDGVVVLSDVLHPILKDEQHQFVYNGNINNVYEELPTGNYLPPVNQAWRDLFTNVRREPLSMAQLESEVNRQASGQIAAAIIRFFK